VHGRDAIFVHWSASFLGADDDWLDRDDIPLLCTKAGASHSGSRKPDIIMDPCESLKTQAMRGLLFGPVRGNLFRFERALLRDFFFSLLWGRNIGFRGSKRMISPGWRLSQGLPSSQGRQGHPGSLALVQDHGPTRSETSKAPGPKGPKGPFTGGVPVREVHLGPFRAQ
jgi:hypothetical protein